MSIVRTIMPAAGHGDRRVVAAKKPRKADWTSRTTKGERGRRRCAALRQGIPVGDEIYWFPMNLAAKVDADGKALPEAVVRALMG